MLEFQNEILAIVMNSITLSPCVKVPIIHVTYYNMIYHINNNIMTNLLGIFYRISVY